MCHTGASSPLMKNFISKCDDQVFIDTDRHS